MRRAPDVRCSPPARDRQRGAVLVEMALLLPVFAALLVTVTNLGWALREYAVLQNAAREAARFSIHPPNHVDPRSPTATLDAVRARVVDYMAQEHLSVDAVRVTVTQTEPILVDGLTLDGSEVVVSYERELLIPGRGLLPSPTVTLSATAVFRNLY